MKKKFILIIFSTFFINLNTKVFASVEENFFGVQESLMSSKTTISEVASKKIDIYSDEYNFGFGVYLNYFLHLSKEKYFLTFGTSFDTKKLSIKGTFDKKKIDESFNMKYISISPFGVFLKTDDLFFLDFFLIFMASVDLKFLIDKGPKLNSTEDFFIKDLSTFGLEIKVKLGIEYTIGDTTSFLTGFILNFDTLNCIKKLSTETLKIKPMIYRFGIFFGVKF